MGFQFAMNRWSSYCLLGCSASYPCCHFNGLTIAPTFSLPFCETFIVIFFCLKVGGGPETASDVANTIMQKFWDSARALELPEEESDSHRYHHPSTFPQESSFWFPQTLCLREIIALCSELSLVMPSEIGDGSSNYPPDVGNSCAFKLQDKKGRIHRFTCGVC
jgi:hypothetical protein